MINAANFVLGFLGILTFSILGLGSAYLLEEKFDAEVASHPGFSFLLLAPFTTIFLFLFLHRIFRELKGRIGGLL